MLIRGEVVLRSGNKKDFITCKQFMPECTPVVESFDKPSMYLMLIAKVDRSSLKPVFCFSGSGIKRKAAVSLRTQDKGLVA
ncbi:hypothetical protein D3C87_1682210 [compost metagenome]